MLACVWLCSNLLILIFLLHATIFVLTVRVEDSYPREDLQIRLEEVGRITSWSIVKCKQTLRIFENHETGQMRCSLIALAADPSPVPNGGVPLVPNGVPPRWARVWS